MSTTRNRFKAPLRRLSEPTNGIDVVHGVLVQIARKLLFIPPVKKAIFYITLISLLSMVSSYVDLPENYFMQKHNVFNVYGTKLGWFWTVTISAPFIALTSFLHYNSAAMTFLHMTRLVVATFFWYGCTHTFTALERVTSKCHGATALQRRECFDLGGKWVPGFDISGHTFILLYSILLMSEEAISFRNWPISPKSTPINQPNKNDQSEFQKRTRTVQWLFIGIFIVHIIWDFQLIITSLYYHAVSHKILGGLFAIASWFVTYRLWYPKYHIPGLPVQRVSKAF
ncbi:hypothetical protein M3Y98_00660300 [Aphelenchoides besseyi]|nr:hypothetical protein M3Y98_00660300 [Aphelenchoides besseyi]KAI6208787.1 hypothetical protein M3Y96_00152200 [Aphelenchoides besseyi]